MSLAYLTILKDLNIAVCDCGILVQMDAAFKDQVDYNAIKQKIRCPVCKIVISTRDEEDTQDERK